MELAIRADRRYCLRTDSDPDFDQLRPQVQQLFTSLKDEARRQAENNWEEIQKYLAEWMFLGKKGKKAKDKIDHLLNKAKNLLEKGTYFDYLNVLIDDYRNLIKQIVINTKLANDWRLFTLKGRKGLAGCKSRPLVKTVKIALGA